MKRCADTRRIVVLIYVQAQSRREIPVLLSRNSAVKAIRVKAIEGKPTYGGSLLVKPLITLSAGAGPPIVFLAPTGAHLKISLVSSAIAI